MVYYSVTKKIVPAGLQMKITYCLTETTHVWYIEKVLQVNITVTYLNKAPGLFRLQKWGVV